MAQEDPITEDEGNVRRLTDDLLRVADDAAAIAARVARCEELPAPIVAGITDRAIQLASMLRLIAHELSLITPRGTPLDIPFDP